MPGVLLCSHKDILKELGGTLLARAGIDRFKATQLEDAKLLARTTRPALILLDRDMHDVREFLEALREEPATRTRSIAILARGELEPSELELLELGANAILRLPPDDGWDDRVSRLLQVPQRHDARLQVLLAVSVDAPDVVITQALNLSATGMLVESRTPLQMYQAVSFRFRLPDGARVSGSARVVRQATSTQYGLEFVRLDEDGKEAIQQYVRSASG
jgi:CheY-like chemotaxis protein